MTVCENFKVPNVKIFYDPRDLENTVKVKLMTYNKRSCHYASWVKISSLYFKWLLIYGHLTTPLVIIGKFLLTHKIQKGGPSDLILGMPYSIHLRYPQV